MIDPTSTPSLVALAAFVMLPYPQAEAASTFTPTQSIEWLGADAVPTVAQFGGFWTASNQRGTGDRSEPSHGQMAVGVSDRRCDRACGWSGAAAGRVEYGCRRQAPEQPTHRGRRVQSGTRPGAVTAILARTSEDPRTTFDELLPIVYEELRRMARRQLAGEWRQKTLDTTGLVHEAYLKLVDQTAVPLKNRAYFFGAASHAMRQVLVDAARRRNRAKRGGGVPALPLSESMVAVDGLASDLVDLDGALSDLAVIFPRQARVVECRFFGGLSVEETAAALDSSPRTVKRDWSLARAWLFRRIQDGERMTEES